MFLCVGRYVAETVSCRFAGLAAPYNPNDVTYKGDKVDEKPTAALAYVVHTAPCESETGEKECKAYQIADDREYARRKAEEAEHKTHDDLEQVEPPELGASSAA